MNIPFCAAAHPTIIRNSGHAMLKGWSLIFYGTTQSIDKNDPVSVPVIPPAPIVNNPVTILSKSSMAKGNRKQQKQQQQQQQQKSNNNNTHASGNNSSMSNSNQQTTSRKNGKGNQKHMPGKGNKQKQQQQTSSVRPPTTLYFNKDRKYEFINGVISVNKPSSSQTTTVKPLKASNNGQKNNGKTAYPKTPIKAPKQVKNNDEENQQHNENGNASDVRSKVSSTNASSSTTITFDSTADVEIVDNIQFSSNPNIPKLFQQYEKIQEFYPEFHPYVGVNGYTGKMSTASNASGGSSGNGKPSRANQPFQSQFPSSLSIASSGFPSSSSQTSKMLSTALLGTATKKSPSSSQMSARTQQQSSVFGRKPAKG